MTSTDRPQFNTEKDRNLILETSNELNEHYRKGGWVWERGSLRLLRKLPRPICIDFDSTLTIYWKLPDKERGDKRFYTADPDALATLTGLQEIGSVVVLTGNNDNWETRYQAMSEMGIWLPGMTMIDADNYRAEFSLARSRGVGDNDVHIYGRNAVKKDVRDYNRLEKRKKQEFDRYYEKKRPELKAHPNWNNSLQPKNIAPALNKSYDVPIIDDRPWNTEIPGMHGITVRGIEWDDDFKGLKYDEGYSYTSLMEAVERVTEHYLRVLKVQK